MLSTHSRFGPEVFRQLETNGLLLRGIWTRYLRVMTEGEIDIQTKETQPDDSTTRSTPADEWKPDRHEARGRFHETVGAAVGGGDALQRDFTQATVESHAMDSHPGLESLLAVLYRVFSQQKCFRRRHHHGTRRR